MRERKTCGEKDYDNHHQISISAGVLIAVPLGVVDLVSTVVGLMRLPFSLRSLDPSSAFSLEI
jgi:hypothetical protein